VKPKVLHIIDSFESGGTERQAIQLVRLLNDSGECEVHLACLQNKGLLRAQAEQLGLSEIVEYPLSSFYDANFMKQVNKLRRYLLEHEIDVVHSHCFYTNIFGMTAASLAHTPARITYKGETDFRTAAQKRAERVAFRLSHRVVANSDAVRARLINEGVPGDKIVRHYNGLDMQRITVSANATRAQALQNLSLPASPTRKFITIVANLRHTVKDIPMFLRAAARVHTSVAEAAFIVAGEGELEAELKALAGELGIASDVFFIGRCDRIAELLFISDVCALSSTAEGFSNSILEYMASARPVVATDVGGAREAIVEGETGFIVSSGDDEAMAARIVDLLCDGQRARAMGARGMRRVEECFSTQRHLANTLGLYSELLNKVSTAEPREEFTEMAEETARLVVR
jgi:glycosyltransferase involved in cell wall biosynthesis